MTIKVSVLPEEIYTPELTRFIDDLIINVQTEIDSINDVAIREEIPKRPREGKIYYLKEDLDNIATEGYWAWINGSWQKFNMGNAVYETDYITQELERRCENESA